MWEERLVNSMEVRNLPVNPPKPKKVTSKSVINVLLKIE